MADEQDLAREIGQAWIENARNMADGDRPIEVFEHIVFDDPNVVWFAVPKHRAWIYFRNIIPGLSADFHVLNRDGRKALDAIPWVRNQISHVMRELQLLRVNCILPAPVKKVIQATESLGFKFEGKMRRALYFDGRPVDALIYGMTRADVLGLDKVQDNVKAGRKKKRRRKRGKKTSPPPKASPNPPMGATKLAPMEMPEDKGG